MKSRRGVLFAFTVLALIAFFLGRYLTKGAGIVLAPPMSDQLNLEEATIFDDISSGNTDGPVDLSNVPRETILKYFFSKNQQDLFLFEKNCSITSLNKDTRELSLSCENSSTSTVKLANPFFIDCSVQGRKVNKERLYERMISDADEARLALLYNDVMLSLDTKDSDKFTLIEEIQKSPEKYYATIRILKDSTSLLGGVNQIDLIRFYIDESIRCNL